MPNKKELKIGLALGSGAARGIAHIGVINALNEKNIPIDMIAGSSFGALAGACYAKEGSIKDLEEVALKFDWIKLTQLADLNLASLFKGFFMGEKIKELLTVLLGDIEFKDLKIPLAVTATDIDTGEAIIIKEGSVVEAIRASISMPVLLTPVKFGERWLIDGGLTNPLPIITAREIGADFVIACNVIQKPHKIKHHPKKDTEHPTQTPETINKNMFLASMNNKINQIIQENKDKLNFLHNHNNHNNHKDTDVPSIYNVIIKGIYIMEYEVVKEKLRDADLLISPDIKNIEPLQFYKGKEAIEEGYKAAMAINFDKLISDHQKQRKKKLKFRLPFAIE